MKRLAWTAVILASLAASAGAQVAPKPTDIKAPEGLKPTDILDYGKVAGAFRLDYDYIGASLKSSALAMEVDLSTSRTGGSLDFLGGLGRGIGVEMTLPFSFLESTEGSGSIAGTPIDSHDDASGLGDIELIGNYRIFQEDKTRPHWMAGLIMVLPTGNDTGGIGDGVVKLGMRSGVSKKFGIAGPYGLAEYVLPLGDNEQGGANIDVPGVFALTLGSQFAVAKDVWIAKNVWIDARLVVSIFGSEVVEEAGVRQTAEGFLTMELGAQAYVQLGNGLTVLGGPRIFWPQSHAIDKESGVDFEDSFGFGFTIGVQYVFDAVEPPTTRKPAGRRAKD